MNTKETKQTKEETIAAIAASVGIETLDERKSDRLDFHEMSVWQLKAALEAAYEAGARHQTLRTTKRYPAFNAKGERISVTIPD